MVLPPWPATLSLTPRPLCRWQVLDYGSRRFYLDGAHTTASCRAAAMWFKGEMEKEAAGGQYAPLCLPTALSRPHLRQFAGRWLTVHLCALPLLGMRCPAPARRPWHFSSTALATGFQPSSWSRSSRLPASLASSTPLSPPTWSPSTRKSSRKVGEKEDLEGNRMQGGVERGGRCPESTS